MADATKVKLGVCSVVLDGTDLGHTIGGVEVMYKPEYHKTSVDKYGSSPVEEYLIGESLSAKVPLAEFTVANLKKAMPQGVQSGSKLTLGSFAGKKSTDKSGTLVLHPIANAANDRSEDVALYKAVVTSEVTLPMKNDAEKVIEVTFEAHVDESRGDGSLLGLIGDSLS